MLIALMAVTVSCASDGSEHSFERVQRSATTATRAARSIDGELSAIVGVMTVEQLVGQLVMTRTAEATLSESERAALTQGALTGYILFSWNDAGAERVRALGRDIASRGLAITVDGVPLRIGSLVAADQEGGSIRALPSLPPNRSQMSWGASQPLELERASQRAGRVLRDAGITINLAPVADLPVGPEQVMGTRSFGARPSPLVSAAVHGFEQGGIAATIKHFPGLGGATRNTDEGSAIVGRSSNELAQDIAPFRAGARSGASLVMTSHAIYRELNSSLPATIDPTITGRLLRRELGDDVVVITDSLNAKGIREAAQKTTPQLCPAAIAAGVDVLLLTGSLETARLCRRRLLDELGNDTSGITRSRLERSVLRVLALKARVGLVRNLRTGAPLPAPDRRCCDPARSRD